MKARSICALVAAVAIGVAGCSNNTSTKPEYQIISGQPISVEQNYAHSAGTIATVIKGNDKPILAYRTINSILLRTEEYAKAAVLIQSEISDGDKENIELSGHYNDRGEFVMSRVKANGYQVDF